MTPDSITLETEHIRTQRQERLQGEISEYMDTANFYDVVSWCDAESELATILHLAHNKHALDAIDYIIEIKDRLLRQAAVQHAEKVCD